MTTATAPAPIPPVVIPALDLMIRAARTQVDAFLADQWEEFGRRGRGIRFHKSARTRMGQIIGWLSGMAQSERAMAERLAAQLFDKLDYLAAFGGDVAEKHRVPQHIVKMYDDGTFGGFGLCWYVAVPEHKVKDMPTAKWEEDLTRTWSPIYRYTYSFNGGLLFFGAGDDGVGSPNFSVRLGDNLQAGWSIHT
jgi:hypothetical protein